MNPRRWLIQHLLAPVLDATRGLMERYGCSEQDAVLLNELHSEAAQAAYEIGVVGLQGHGKSTLINALLGRQLLYSSARIATSHIIRLSYGDEEFVSVKLPDGGVRNYPIDALDRLGHRAGEDLPRDALIEVFVRSPALRRGFSLVDTPGLASADQVETDHAVFERYFSRSRSLLVVCHATRPGIQGFSDLMRQAIEQQKEVIVVLTAADLLDDEELEEALTVVRRQISQIGASLPVYAVSALNVLEGRGASSHLGRQFAALCEHITRHAYYAGADYVVSLMQRCVAIARSACEDKRHQVASLNQELAAMLNKRQDAGLAAEQAAGELSALRSDLTKTKQHVMSLLETAKNAALNEGLQIIRQFIYSHDIPAVNSSLTSVIDEVNSHYYTNAVSQILAQIDRFDARTVTLPPCLNSISRDKPVSPPKTRVAIPQMRKSQITKVAEGFWAWLSDTDDSMRKGDLSNQAQSQVERAWDTVVNQLGEQVEKWYQERSAWINGHLQNARHYITRINREVEHKERIVRAEAEKFYALAHEVERLEYQVTHLSYQNSLMDSLTTLARRALAVGLTETPQKLTQLSDFDAFFVYRLLLVSRLTEDEARLVSEAFGVVCPTKDTAICTSVHETDNA
jgi:GTP-binding protein EngB required for normal cell division